MMKTMRVVVCILLAAVSFKAFGRKRDKYHREMYGNTINVSTGMGYYKFIGETVPVGYVNYEFDVADGFTVAPFFAYFGHHDYAYPDKNNPLFRHYYRESVMPVGVTGYYYFDDVLNAGDKWDFYGGLSLGTQVMRKAWTDGYVGSSTVAKGSLEFYYDAHIGVEFHLSHKIGVIADVSRGITMAGVAVHLSE